MTPLQKAFVKDLERLKKKYAKGKNAIIEKAAVTYNGVEYHSEDEILNDYGCAFFSENTRARLTKELEEQNSILNSGPLSYKAIVDFIDDVEKAYIAKGEKL